MDMETRSLLVLLSLFLGTAISLKGAQASTEGCPSINDGERLKIDPGDENVGVFCVGTEWMIGSDLCNLTSFIAYNSCSDAGICHIPSSYFLIEGLTFVCCHQQRDGCSEITIQPRTTHQVPPIMIAGRTETAYTIITAKPRPTETPGVDITPIAGDRTGLPLNSSTIMIPDPLSPIKYFAIHTFVVPSDIDDNGAFIRLEFSLPPGWSFSSSLVSTIPVVPAHAHVVNPPRCLCTVEPGEPETTESSTKGVGEDDTAATCRGPVVIMYTLAAVLAAIVTTAIIVIVGVCYWLKKKQKEKLQCVPSIIVPRNLPLSGPLADQSSSTTTTPGLAPTPVMGADSARLIPWLTARGTSVVTDPATANSTVATNSGFQRQQSRDSNSTTSPMDSDRLLSVPATVTTSSNNLTGSTGLGSSIGTSYNSAQVMNTGLSKISSRDSCSLTIGTLYNGGSGLTFEIGQNYKECPSDERTEGIGNAASVEHLKSSSANIIELMGSGDPKYHSHTYASLLEFQQARPGSISAARGQSLTTGAGGGSTSSMSTCTFQLNGMCNHHSSVPGPSLSATPPGSMGTSSLISPPPPTDPNYSTGGRKMHLPPQYSKDLETNVTDV